MKTTALALLAAGVLTLALAAPREARAGGVHLDVRIGLPVIVKSTHVPVVVHRPLPHRPVVHHHHHHVHHLRHRHHHHAPVWHRKAAATAGISVNSRLRLH